jgi:imidazolonepropionase-like amidohydrolase
MVHELIEKHLRRQTEAVESRRTPSKAMQQLLFTNARIFDGYSADCADGMNVLLADGLIQEVSASPIRAENAQAIDVSGRTLMPGMIDAHIHAFASDLNLQRSLALGTAHQTAHAVRMLGHALNCGFTTVRDVGGGNASLRSALDDGLFQGPRFYYSGRILTMTGGHADYRGLNEAPRYASACSCSGGVFTTLSVVADGVDECIKCAREELRQGAHCIKILGSGGVASPTDPIWMNQYREDEIRAIVNECAERRSYTTSHCHPASAVRRAVECGVRCIEHATLIDAETAAFVAAKGAYVVPTMAIIMAFLETSTGLPKTTEEKIREVSGHAIKSLDILRGAGVKVVYGTDLLGSAYIQQCREFTLRSEVYNPVEILRQATSVAAEMMQLDGQIGCIKPGAHADVLVVDGNPLRDISLLAADGRNLKTIVRGGTVIKNELH